ncbi:FAD-dependent oxidoreductase [Nocardioides marmorisolisilvae]|uniref:FAD-dependent monooxygenase n=1 Tax=Nocardioides marmorisolisilvae TaxID=1542737 RepID=A0A3N0DXB3_9ACTN|nr:FAD-dependent oxidoreductase [Nocardioides marmorisolisilvae]RNL80262.1 FAD-dependent monooxygenase [Nocardioides marmorisolisilvae]
MKAVVAGGGPVGIYAAIALARRGHAVTLVDRDPGPTGSDWQRAGVMQFEHAHGWRPQVVEALRAEMPDVLDALLDAGARLEQLPGMPGIEALACRRPVLERVLRRCAAQEPDLRWRTGHVDRLEVSDGRTSGVVVDGDPLPADLVVVATGRNSRLGDELRGPAEGGSCGFSYVTRVYRALPGTAPYRGFPSFQTGPGYVSVVIGGDGDTHSVVIAYPSHDETFGGLRTEGGFATAAQLVPNLAPWTTPDSFEPLTDVLVGGHLTNTYRLQGPALGLPPATGLFFVGDAVLTTNPAAGRNLALLIPHVRHLLGSLDDHAQDLDDASLALDSWAEQHLRPWYLDHVRWDRTLLERFDGRDLDLAERLPSDVICAAAEVDDSLRPYVGMYFGMVAGPDILDAAEPRVRELLAEGWRPSTPGPTRAELAEALHVPTR